MAGGSRDELTDHERERLDAGYHDEVAASVRERGRVDLAGWVLEQVWDWSGARAAYREADRPLDALRAAVESGTAADLDESVGDIEDDANADLVDQAIALLERKRRPMEAARLLALRDDPKARASALVKAGDRLRAARVLADAQLSKESLDILTDGGLPASSGPLSLAAELAWDLGDAEQAAQYAQRALRAGADDEETYVLLSRALAALGHDLAAQMVLQVHPTGQERQTGDKAVPGRYRVLGLGPSGLVGAAYVGIDRVTMQEVELHLLLAEQHDAGPTDREVAVALERFAVSSESASKIGHPAIRPILRIDPIAGLLVMERAPGTTLRTMIREPGMRAMPSRVRGVIAFLVDGLRAAHARGLVHGWLLPSQLVCDAAGRPMLGPFGAHNLSGLAATHTGSLEEIMTVTAPELRRGGSPTVASDTYAIGALMLALLEGKLSTGDDLGAPTPETQLARSMMAQEPEARAQLSEVLAVLRQPVADVRELETGSGPEGAKKSREAAESDLEVGMTVEASDAWTDELLDALCRLSSPWLQPILDREERVLVLAPWPEGCRTLGADAEPHWRDYVDPLSLMIEDASLREALEERVGPTSLVRTPSGDWMLALDDLLTR